MYWWRDCESVRLILMSAGDWKDMIYAIRDGDLELVRYHINQGVNLNYQHPEFMTTALIESIIFDKSDIAHLLLTSGADPNLRIGFSSDTALSEAKKAKNKAMITLLKNYLPKEKSPFKRIVNKILRIN